MSKHAAWLAAGAMLALAGCAESCRQAPPAARDARATSGLLVERDAGHASAWPRIDLPSPEPRWHVSMPSRAVATALEHVTGPVIVPASEPAPEHAPGKASPEPRTGPGDTLVLVTSSAAGVVALAAGDGAVRWQHDEPAPGVPVVASNGDVWLPGRCAHHMDQTHARFTAGARMTGQESEHVLGCVDIVDHTGRVRDRVWIRVAGDAPDASGRSEARGRRDKNLIWGHGRDLFEISMPTGHVIAQRRALISDNEDGTSTFIKGWPGWLEHGSHLIVTTSAGLAGFAACPEQAVCAPAWRLPWPRAAGVTGPVQAGANLAWVRDQILEAGSHGRITWTAPGFYSYAPGSLTATNDDTLLALQQGQGGLRPVRVAVASGHVVEQGDAVPGAQVLAAAPWGTGLAAVVRLDASLRHDVVIAWDSALNARWAWPVPAPARPRVEPVGIAAVPESAGGGVVVFHDGRFVARLPPP